MLESISLNAESPDFRKAAKLAKKWKYNCKKVHGKFELKSFHIERLIARIVKRNPRAELAAILFEFFCDLPNAIVYPGIPDRADPTRFVDDYVEDLNEEERRAIVEARDFFLIELENLTEWSSVGGLLAGTRHARAGHQERSLFDQKIPVLTDSDVGLRIRGRVQARPGFRAFELDASGLINVERRIAFSADVSAPEGYDLLKWKVKNDNSSPEPRGEITDHNPRNNPERTRYKGAHFVECYVIKQGSCIARRKQNVVLR